MVSPTSASQCAEPAGASANGWPRRARGALGVIWSWPHDYGVTRPKRATGRDSPHPRVQDAPDSAAVMWLARVGLVSYGVVHLLIAWLALQVAWGIPGGGAPDQSGAMAAVASTPLGPPLLYVLAIGLAALALWQLGELRLLWRHAGPDGGRRAAAAGTVESVGKAAGYLGLAVLAVRFATATGSTSSSGPQRATSGVFALPGGRLIVAATALVVAGVGVRQWVTGLREDFLDEIDTSQVSATRRRTLRWLGRVGFPAKGTALIVVGALFGWATARYDASKATGLDGAIHTIVAAPFGQALLTIVALGIGAFGLFSLMRARYPSRT